MSHFVELNPHTIPLVRESGFLQFYAARTAIPLVDLVAEQKAAALTGVLLRLTKPQPVDAVRRQLMHALQLPAELAWLLVEVLLNLGVLQLHRPAQVGLTGSGPATRLAYQLFAEAGWEIFPLAPPRHDSPWVVFADALHSVQVMDMVGKHQVVIPVLPLDGAFVIGPLRHPGLPQVPCVHCFVLWQRKQDPAWLQLMQQQQDGAFLWHDPVIAAQMAAEAVTLAAVLDPGGAKAPVGLRRQLPDPGMVEIIDPYRGKRWFSQVPVFPACPFCHQQAEQLPVPPPAMQPLPEPGAETPPLPLSATQKQQLLALRRAKDHSFSKAQAVDQAQKLLQQQAQTAKQHWLASGQGQSLISATKADLLGKNVQPDPQLQQLETAFRQAAHGAGGGWQLSDEELIARMQQILTGLPGE